MTFLTQSIDAVRRRFSRRISGAAIGIIVNEVTDGDLAALGALSRPARRPLVRTMNLGDPASAQRILTLLAEDYPLLVTVPFGKGYGPVGHGITLQIDHEPDRQSPAVSPWHYGTTFYSTMKAMRMRLPSTIPIVTAGFSATAEMQWMANALSAGAGEADAVCFHVEGADLSTALRHRLEIMREAMAIAGCEKPLWITALRPLAGSHKENATQLKACLALPELRTVARVYVAELTSEDWDLVGICDHDLSRTPRPAYSVVRAAIRRP